MNGFDDGPIPPPCPYCGEFHLPANCPYYQPGEEDAWYDQNVPYYAQHITSGEVQFWYIGIDGFEVPSYSYRQVCDRSPN